MNLRKRISLGIAALVLTSAISYVIVTKDKTEERLLVFKDYKQLAENGDKHAQWILGRYYESGLDVNKDLVRSSNWFKKSAEQNYPNAFYDLGLHYRHGIGVEISNIHAAFWLLKAANTEDEYTAGSAKVCLGEIYERGGHGITRDEAEAYAWYMLALQSNYQTVKSNAERHLNDWRLLNEKEFKIQGNLRLEELAKRVERLKTDEKAFSLLNEIKK